MASAENTCLVEMGLLDMPDSMDVKRFTRVAVWGHHDGYHGERRRAYYDKRLLGELSGVSLQRTRCSRGGAAGVPVSFRLHIFDRHCEAQLPKAMKMSNSSI